MQDRWTNQIDKVTNDFSNSFGRLSIAELNWKPNPNTWSIAQNLDHLIVINGTYHPVIKSCSDLLDKGTVISSPANRNVVYRLETAFDIIVSHELRHFEQSLDVE